MTPILLDDTLTEDELAEATAESQAIERNES